MSRMKIVQAPLEFKQKACLVTGRSDGDVVDFGVEAKVGPLPRVYIKRSEIEKAGKLCDMLDASEVAALQEERTDLIEENAGLRGEVKTIELRTHSAVNSMAYAAAATAGAKILELYPDLDIPTEVITEAVEELFEPSSDEITNHQEA